MKYPFDGFPGIAAPRRAGLLSELQSLDERIGALGLKIWIGSEPTFTDRWSEAPEWLSNALGGDKAQRAERLLRQLAIAFPGSAVLRTLGRQYPGEPRARWSIGLYGRRDGEPAWQGPPDPLLTTRDCAAWSPDGLLQALETAAAGRGWSGFRLTCETAPGERLVLRLDGAPCTPELVDRQDGCRPSVHDGPIPDAGLSDRLADAGFFLIALDRDEEGGWPRLELPRIGSAPEYLALLSVLSEACRAAGITGVRLCGHPPPVDRHVQWSTLTPDPAVIEANLAPAESLVAFHEVLRRLFAAAEHESLAPYRLHYNGRQSDSGGGGQLTIGGPTPDGSPFFYEPRLLPRLIRYFNRHPVLSYWFNTDYLGSGSQAPRCDEGLQELFPELALALDLLSRRTFPDPESIWGSLAPFLADAGGNSHRSEINIEKLWNPWLGERGRQGLVELRPFRMLPTTSALAALAALVRALVARLMQYPYDDPLVQWGERLHSRFALPFYLRQDLLEVLRDLDAKGLGLGPSLSGHLLDESGWELGRREWKGVTVRLMRALEFWPLIGDHGAPRPADSRLVDASTLRRELRLSAPDPALLSDIEVRVNGYRVPLRTEAGEYTTRLTGIRYRSFTPHNGLHPGLKGRFKVGITLIHHPSAGALHLDLHEWRPDGAAYNGLPRDRAEAARRRGERFITRESGTALLGTALRIPKDALSEYCIDLRRL